MKDVFFLKNFKLAGALQFLGIEETFIKEHEGAEQIVRQCSFPTLLLTRADNYLSAARRC